MKQKNYLSLISLLLLWVFSSLAFSQPLPADSYITSDVQIKINNETALNDVEIVVSTSKGVVSLKGVVNSDAQAAKATELAQESPGVTDVDTSNLTINGKQKPATDSIITARIKGLFIQHKLLGNGNGTAGDLTVETVNGIVTLEGTLENQEQVNAALSIAKSVQGVKAVKTNIKIS